PAPRPAPAWMGRVLGSLGELLSRSVRLSNRTFREAGGWAPRYPSLREGWPALLAEMRGGSLPGEGTAGWGTGRSAAERHAPNPLFPSA
ncbi:MAG TPA: hypothetical protein VK358_07085, partial [Longimicrobium sp.]|nr:hypothetical protein [Longimicrobium sp.]